MVTATGRANQLLPCYLLRENPRDSIARRQWKSSDVIPPESTLALYVLQLTKPHGDARMPVRGPLAQSVEHLPFKQGVVGSSPTRLIRITAFRRLP